MSIKKIFIHYLVLPSFFLLLIIMTFAIWISVIGIPGLARKTIINHMHEQGIAMDSGKIRVGVIKGIEINDAVIHDFRYPEIELLRAKHVRIRFHIKEFIIKRKLSVREIRVEGGAITLPVKQNGQAPRILGRIDQLNIVVAHDSGNFEIRKLNGRMEKVPTSVAGLIAGASAKDSGRPDFWELLAQYLPLTAAKWSDKVTANIQDRVRALRQCLESIKDPSSSAININIHVPLENPRNSDLTFDIGLNGLLFRGLDVGKIEINSRFSKQSLIVSEFRMEAGTREYLRGSTTIDFGANQIHGALSFYGYPRKLIKVFDKRLTEVFSEFIPVHEGKPVMVSATLERSPLNRPKDWRAHVDLGFDNVRVHEAVLKSLTGSVIVKDRSLFFRDVQASVEPNMDMTVSGRYDLDKRDLIVQATGYGDPRKIASFSADARFRENYLDVWKAFAWNDNDRPFFDVDLYYNSKFPRSGIVINAFSRMTNIRYNNVAIEKVSGHILLDYPGEILVISDIDVVVKNQNAAGDLVWNGGDKTLRFSLASDIDPNALMALFHVNWHRFLGDRGFSFESSPHVEATGVTRTDTGQDTIVNVLVDGDGLGYFESDIHQFQANLTIADQIIDIRTIINEIKLDNLAMHDVSARLVIDGEKLDVNGQSDLIDAAGFKLIGSDFQAVRRNSGFDVISHSETIRYDDWNISDINAKSNYDNGVLTCEATAESAQHNDIIATKMLVNFTMSGGTSSGTLEAHEIYRDDVFHVTGVDAEFELDYPHKLISGKILEFKHAPTEGTSSDMTVIYRQDDQGARITAQTNSLSFLHNSELFDVRVETVLEEDEISGTFQIGKAMLADRLTGTAVDGSFNRRGSSWTYDSMWNRFDHPVGRLDHMRASGNLNPENLQIFVEAGTGTVLGYDWTNVNASVAYGNDELSINGIRGKFYGGDAQAELYYRPKEQIGKLWLTLADVDFNGLMKKTLQPGNRERVGVFNGNSEVNLAIVADRLDLVGDGKISIKKGNFWKIPIMSDFMNMLSNITVIGKVIPDLGKISELNSDLQFRHDHVHFPNLATNGNLVAINAVGDYWWDSRKVDFRVIAKPLKPFFSKVLPQIIDPFQILLERRLRGTINKPEWEEVSAIRDLFRTKEVQ